MPRSTASRSASASESNDDVGALALRLVELLNEDIVVDKLIDKLGRKLYPKELFEKVESLTQHVVWLKQNIEEREGRIKQLEEKVRVLESDGDGVEQYTRRANTQVRGIPEHPAEGENTDALVLDLLNVKLNMQPPIELHHIARSHRLGRKVDGQGRQNTRPIIVRFSGERVRDEVYRARTRLKQHNTHHKDAMIFINDDLTARRAKLAFDTRMLKREKKISDCWTSYGNVMLKTTTGLVKEVKSQTDLQNI